MRIRSSVFKHRVLVADILEKFMSRVRTAIASRRVCQCAPLSKRQYSTKVLTSCYYQVAAVTYHFYFMFHSIFLHI